MQNIHLHGDERELTLMARSRAGLLVSPGKLIDPVMEKIRLLAPTVPLSDRSGVFLTHGRVYRESGGLLELASADTQSPFEAVRQGVLLRHVIADALDALEQEAGLQGFVVSQHNTAYPTDKPSHATAGHFNITRYRRVSEYLPGLVTLGAALPCISGGGGLDMESLQFTLSVRGLRCLKLMSSKTQSDRGIIDTKAMPASQGDRQQILIIDNLQSHVQTRCVYTLINLFYRCMENAEAAFPVIELKEPLEDMHRMIRGPRLDHPFTSVDGRRFKATEILRRFLEWYATHLKADWMPPWAETEIALTMESIDLLDAKGLGGAVGLMDHATLHYLWQVTLNEYGLDPDRAETARKLLVQMAGAYKGPTILQDAAAPLVKCANAIAGELGRPSTICSDYATAARKFMQLAHVYGDIRHKGVHAQLVETGMTSAGVLFDTEHCRAHANTAVPACEGRAAARSETILKLNADGVAKYSIASWDSIQSPSLGVLDLGNYANTDTNHWRKASSKPERKTLSDSGFDALHEFLREREG